MRLASITGYNPSGKGFWHHVVPADGICVAVAGGMMLVVRTAGDDYYLHDDGSAELVKTYPALHQDND